MMKLQKLRVLVYSLDQTRQQDKLRQSLLLYVVLDVVVYVCTRGQGDHLITGTGRNSKQTVHKNHVEIKCACAPQAETLSE